MTFDDRMGRQVTGVAGAYAPAFVERVQEKNALFLKMGVSPELMLRPSLSVLRNAGRLQLRLECRRSLCSGLR